MNISHVLSSPSHTTSRTLLFVSLALNLFFIGSAVALFVTQPEGPPPRNVAARLEELAKALPQADGDKLRDGFASERTPVEAARADYEKAREGIREVLRREPFDPAALEAQMSKTRAAHEQFDIALQGVLAKAAGGMSSAGRRAMADWSPASRQRSKR